MNTSLTNEKRFALRKKQPTPKQNLKRRKLSQKIAFGFFWLMGLIAIAVLFWIVGYVLAKGASSINLEFLTTRPAGGFDGEGGISTTIVTTIYLVLFTIVIAAPLGVGAGIYFVEYANEAQNHNKFVRWLIKTARTGVEILAGVPSIIFGLFGFAVFVSYMKLGFSLLSAGLSGACMVLPVIIRTTEEALLAVPDSYRQASLGLGATKWQTVTGVILPTALPGIVTGIVLSVGRIISETAVFWVTLGGSYRLPQNLMSSGRTLALHVYMLATETRAFDKALGTSAILIIIIILLNLAINITSRRFQKRLSGK
ncbi:MAG TPA: phosphate ABC transporter permease PtsA [Anaerolineaceae bacterium]|uniref:Phosphate transport system permease protein PstA n=1 Tax=Anaerolinea thermophila TaxID=167964 RepID=A0A101FYZ2_9CHLR|nr:MAG: Phosphate ABC transporter membrane protein 2, PhoT family [Anaerolinea thermophila]HAF61834.1 phosphate ABC transporter permease PtsA [Anaerolineaceae bacterium]